MSAAMIVEAHRVLERVFGYDDFRPSQAEVIGTLLAGRDCLALMPTGGGKSLCYQIPALVRPGLGLVVSPLIALMQDQVVALRELGIRAACLNSSQSPEEQRAIEDDVRAGRLDLLYMAPERLLHGRTLALLRPLELALIAIDEAHCVVQWGHDFRPEYRRLACLAEHFPGVPRIALTATADRRSRDEIVTQLGLVEAGIHVSSFDRPNIEYSIQSVQNGREALWRFIEDCHPHDAGIVYCLSRRKVEAVAEWLSRQGRVALPYHAGLSDEVRQRHHERFLREEGVIVVATIAFGMGIDKPDVRFVAHLNLPRSIEAYYQETGRAGRDGAPASAWLCYQLQDVIALRQMVAAGEGSEAFKRQAHGQLEAMLGLCEIHSCRRQALLAYFDETLDAPCGNCDNCLRPPETWDATEVARKALSCVYRCGQGFGVNYLITVLRGGDDARIRSYGHDRLTTFGLGRELSEREWRGVFRQLIALGYLNVDVEAHGALRLSERCRPLLRGEERLLLRKMVGGRRRPTTTRRPECDLDEPGLRLFERLRTLRSELAREQGMPPYVIFHDATLQALASQRPHDLGALADVHGIGQNKLTRYGRQIVDLIRTFDTEAMGMEA